MKEFPNENMAGKARVIKVINKLDRVVVLIKQLWDRKEMRGGREEQTDDQSSYWWLWNTG